ncbi:E3 ubiquitin-protein ligase MSL2a [Aplochiton taeniatus]
MNPVNATALYVSACRAVLQCDPRQPNTFSEMYKLMPFFRQSLSCLVCGNLLQDPIAPNNSSCQHYVCRSCRGQKMLLKPSCSWCKDYSCFEENKPLSLLVHSYRQLCLYITHSPLLQPISSQVGGSPEVIALIEEVLVSREEEVLVSKEEETEEPIPAFEEPNPSAALSVLSPPPPVAVEQTANLQGNPSALPCSNGPQGCNGAGLEDLLPSSPELEVCDLVEEQGPLSTPLDGARDGSGGLQLTLSSGHQGSLREGDPTYREVEEGEILLLSVEEVLQTLDPLQPSNDSNSQPDTQTYIQLDRAHNYTHIHADRTHAGSRHAAHAYTSALEPPPSPKPPPVHLHRKRSRSESDRERVQPLPIACILQDPTSHPLSPAPSHPPHTQRAVPSLPLPTHTYSSLSNGGPPKPSRPSLSSSKAVRKHPEQGPKRPHAKARAGGPKAKERGRDHRLMSSCLLPPSPAKPLYKKPVEKKGCKCGRATQNPSVLTCRGQRCPCYSNRKACLDCICRGCQNSYMANGEKKLEAFAVPEKALEQTRLTLGINLTSITAAAALRNPATSSVHGNTILNVTTATGAPVATAFLSPSPPPDPTYEDSLELGFHC